MVSLSYFQEMFRLANTFHKCLYLNFYFYVIKSGFYRDRLIYEYIYIYIYTEQESVSEFQVSNFYQLLIIFDKSWYETTDKKQQKNDSLANNRFNI